MRFAACTLGGSGASVKATRITAEFTWESFREHYGDNAVPLFLIRDEKRLTIVTEDTAVEPIAGNTVISLVLEDE